MESDGVWAQSRKFSCGFPGETRQRLREGIQAQRSGCKTYSRYVDYTCKPRHLAGMSLACPRRPLD